MTETPRADLVLSYTRVRTALGILGMSLPLILVLGGLLDQPRVDAATGEIEPTISDFYHTTYRDIFVGTLCAIGVFLISYRGYGRDKGDWINDDWLATTAGVGAFGVAFFPNEGGGDAVVSMTQRLIGTDLTPVLHYLSALVFFSSLAAFCFVKFARTCSMGRRHIYKACGWGIIAALVLTAIAVVFKRFIGGTGKERTGDVARNFPTLFQILIQKLLTIPALKLMHDPLHASPACAEHFVLYRPPS